MSKGFFHVPVPKNEPVLSYGPGTKEREAIKKALDEARSKQIDIPMYIGGDEVRSGNKKPITPPHDHKHILGYYHEGDKGHIEQAINAALGSKQAWTELGW